MSGAYEKLARPIQKWVRNAGWRELRDIQARATFAVFESSGDVIVAASTSGGKTEAAFLPLLSQVIDSPRTTGGFDILYIAPLKALITDQARRLSSICVETGIKVTPWHGDVSASIKSKARKNPSGVLLITPESLEALFIRRGLEIERLFGATRAVVIDELHSVLDIERGVQLRSLLTRLELATKRQIRRIGLSATLGDMDLAKSYLRADSPKSVILIEAKGGSAELQVQLRGYVEGEDDKDTLPAAQTISTHLFQNLRGADNLVFAGSRQSVELYTDRLRTLCDDERLPQEFYAHHANLARDHRDFVEQRLKDGKDPTTAICTSTLELGIDIGDVACVAQIGAPFSVASLRQRLGRSGRREGRPAILRQYIVEAKLTTKSNFADRLRLGLVRAIAMIELLLERWCEPPQSTALHLSTLVHQVLSLIAQHGGVKPPSLFKTLCIDGPFRQVDQGTFLEVLRALGSHNSPLIEQDVTGLLLLGAGGEKLVEHHSFYAAFQTPDEYRLLTSSKDLGSIPVQNVITPGMLLIFGGRRWQVIDVDDQARVISVTPSTAGVPPKFGGDVGSIHDRVIEKMFQILEGVDRPIYLDQTAVDLLDEARREYARSLFGSNRIVQVGERAFAIATRRGTVKTNTLALALIAKGLSVQVYDGFLEVTGGADFESLKATIQEISVSSNIDLFKHKPNLVFEKFHRFLPNALLKLDALSTRFAVEALPEICRELT